IEHQARGADFEEKCGGQNIAVAVNEMEPAILARIGQWFIARVDNGSIVLHPFEEVVLDVIGALGNLEQGRLLALDHLTAKTRGPNRSDASSAGKKHPQREESEQRKNVGFVQRRLAVEGIIFVATEGRAGVMVHVIADETDLLLQAQGAHGLLQKQ